jgi:hypothetical protein
LTPSNGVVPKDRPITRDDLRAGFAELQGEVEDQAETAKPYVLMAGIAGVVVIVGVAFVLGRRRGKQQKTYIEIRRV